jgi:RES domain-containing protein
VIVRAWRIVKKRHAASAFDGEGGREHGGRWNSPGQPAVYTAGHVSLAILEIVVNADMRLAFRYTIIPVAFDESLVETLSVSRLPADWRAYPAPSAVVALGDEWLQSGRTTVLKVPSAVVPSEPNYILNPIHPRFRDIRIGAPEELEVDPRLSRHARSAGRG